MLSDVFKAQPHHALKSTRKADSFEESTDVEDSSESTQLNSSFTEQKIPVKTEVSSVSSEYNSQPNVTIARNKDYNISNIVEPPSNESAPPFNPNYCKDYPQNAAVNLTQSSFSRGRNSPQFLTTGVKNPSVVSRGPHLNYDHFKYSAYAPDNQPTNLSVNSFAMCNSDNVYSQTAPNLPINLSNSIDGNESTALPFKATIPYKSLDVPCGQPRNDSLNLSTNRREWLPQDSPNVVPKLPLPGKKMFLETYNANQSMLSNMNCNEQILKPSQSPDTGQYLPKKMRATESFGSKLTSARFFANASADSQQMEPDKYNKVVMDDFPPPPSPKIIQNIVPNPNLVVNYENVMNESVVDHSPPQNLNSPNMINAEHKLNMLGPDKMHYGPRRGQKNLKNKKSKIKSPDASTNSFSDNIECVQSLPVKTRGRPRKKSLSKPKDVRKLTRTNAMNHAQCEHKKHSKRSSDSFSSLTECINIKTGIICAEKHAEILNRERVHSICNMDKHALDDYLNEGNSQEHEEELMRYFQSNDDNPVADNAAKTDLEEIVSTPKGGKSNGLDIEKADVVIPSDSAVITSKCATKDSLDVHEDHSQGKNEKISQLREILQKNLKHNTNASLTSTLDDEKPNNSETVCGFPHSTAFATITRRKVDGAHDNFEYKEGSAAASLTMLSMKQQSNAAERPSAINVRRRVSFEKPAKESNDQHNVPPSPTSRLQQFIFMPISPGRTSPVSSNKNSPTVAPYKPSSSPSKNLPTIPCTSPVSLSSSASPFVSPRNTPVPRARNSCHEKPIPSKFQSKKMLPRLGIPKCPFVGDKPREMCNMTKGHNELGNFIMPNDQSTVPRSPSYMPNKVRTFPMSAPPSPNILTPKYKPNFSVQTSSSPHIMRSMSQDMNSSMYVNNESLIAKDTVQNEPSQPLSADPHSHEISQFFAGNNICLDDPNNSLRSQSVPLHQNGIIADNQAFYNHPTNPMHNINYLSYNNTPCNSVPPTPIPSEFCDFGSLNDTCESISKGLNSENLDTIYNVLDSNTQEALNKVVEQNEMLLNNPDNIAMSNFDQNASGNDALNVPLLVGLEPMMFDNNGDLSKIPFGEQLPNKYELPQEFRQSQMLVSDTVKRSNSVEVHVPNTSIDNRFFMSRSVPSTPLPSAKTQMPNFDLNETQIISQFQDDYGKQNCSKGLISKSVPSTPQLTDDRNIFSYSNRDFLINGNSVDPNVSNGFGEKKLQSDQLEQSFLNDSTSLIEDKSSSVLVGFSNSPLRETIDMVNNDLAPFNDDCINMDTENDLLNTIL